MLPRLGENLRVTVIGAGPQATGHADALASVRRVDSIHYLVRNPSRTALDALALGSHEATTALRTADVVVCATSARTPLFDSALLRDDAVVIAVGSHEPGARELDSALLARCTVVVEDVATALREAGDVVIAVAHHALAQEDLVSMRDVVTGARPLPDGGPVVFKSVGMAWQDLVIAEAVSRLYEDETTSS